MRNRFEGSDTFVLALMEFAAVRPVPNTSPSGTFLLRAAAAAQRAADLRQMATAACEVGFKPLPLPDYLAAVAVGAKISLSRVLPNVSGSLLEPWVQLGRDIALPTQRLRLLVRAFVAAREAPTRPMVFARGNCAGEANASAIPDNVSEHECERLLTRIESSYSAETRSRLDETLTRLNL